MPTSSPRPAIGAAALLGDARRRARPGRPRPGWLASASSSGAEVAHQVGVGDRDVVLHGEQRGVAVVADPRPRDADDVVHPRQAPAERVR